MIAPVIYNLLTLKIPFAVVNSNSPLGGDRFVVALSKDVSRYEHIKSVHSPSLPQTSEISLSESDCAYVLSLFGKGTFTLQDLPDDAGSVYELVSLPFKAYYDCHLKEVRMREKPKQMDIEQAVKELPREKRRGLESRKVEAGLSKGEPLRTPKQTKEDRLARRKATIASRKEQLKNQKKLAV